MGSILLPYSVSLISSCKINRHNLNQLRVHSEELERLLEMYVARETYAYNRSRVLVNHMVETLWYCTGEGDHI